MNIFQGLKGVVLGLLLCPLAEAEAKNPLRLTRGTLGTWNAEWDGAADRTDFLQWSADLRDWHFMPVMEHGAGLRSYAFSSSTPQLFVRLKFAFRETTDAEHDDYDYDGISNIDEVTLYDTDPLEWDTDGDGTPDGWEITHFLNPRDDGSIDPGNGANGDPDGDGLTNIDEFYWQGDPHSEDTDDDGLFDGVEVHIYQSFPNSKDSDWDSLEDAVEVLIYHTLPNKWDTDGDAISDGAEITTHGTDPLLFDTDGDWMPDDWEIDHGLDPSDSTDGLLDYDSDGLKNQLEYVSMDQGYDPFVANASTDFPWDADPDFDGLTTAQEFTITHSNPRQPDTDDDGMDDG